MTLRARLLDTVLRRYAARQAAAVAPLAIGERLLDLGAGEGYVGAALARRTGFRICSVDVGPFRRAAGSYVVYDGARLPFADAAFDTTLLLLTLHHCTNPEAVLAEAVRVTRHRLIVTESVYRTRLERFWLDLLDGRLNAYRHGGRMPGPFAFRRAESWEALFVARGLVSVHASWLGAWWERLVHHPRLYVLEMPRRGAGISSPPRGERKATAQAALTAAAGRAASR